MSNKKLYRSKRQSVIAGVCGGLAEYFDIDVTIIRLIWAVAFFMGGVGLLAYIVAAIIIPKNENQGTVIIDEDGNEIYVSGGEDSSSVKNNSVLFLGGFLILLGGLVLFDKVFPFRWLWREIKEFAWPVLLIMVGILILMTSIRKKDN